MMWAGDSFVFCDCHTIYSFKSLLKLVSSCQLRRTKYQTCCLPTLTLTLELESGVEWSTAHWLATYLQPLSAAVTFYIFTQTACQQNKLGTSIWMCGHFLAPGIVSRDKSSGFNTEWYSFTFTNKGHLKPLEAVKDKKVVERMFYVGPRDPGICCHIKCEAAAVLQDSSRVTAALQTDM